MKSDTVEILRRSKHYPLHDWPTVKDMNNLPSMVAQTSIGKEAEVIVIRDGKEKRLTVKVGELKEEIEVAGPVIPEIEEGFGLTVQELTPELAEALSLEGEKGVVVSSVRRGSPADEQGIQRGDLIQEIENEPVENMNDYKRIMRDSASKKQILMVIRHQGHTRYAVLKRQDK